MPVEESIIQSNLLEKKRNGVSIGGAILREKLRHPLVIFFLLAASVLAVFVVANFGIKGGILFLVPVVGIPTIVGVLAHPKFGIVLVLLVAYLLMWILRIGVNFPLGTLMDGLQALLLLNFFAQQKTEKNWKIFQSPITILILIWIGYNLLQVANPTAESRLAWIYTIRSTAIVMLMYFIFLFNIRTKALIRFILKLWLGLSFFAALYGIKQEYLGFFDFENQWLMSDPLLYDLLFIGGHWRRFSIFSDPVAFAYNMSIACVFCIALLTGPLSLKKKSVLVGMAICFILSMLYSGTRGAYILVPAAMIMLCILKFNRTILMLTVGAAMLMGAVIVMPTSNPTIARFQSAFKPSEDASFNVRKMNQKRIQPYILSHPLGGGLGATGVWGQRFSPNSFLAKFPPDSGYVRTAVEMGWIGLMLFCTFLFVALRTGIKNYYRISDPELKTYCLGMTLIVYALAIGNYPQEAFVQFPVSVYFYLFLALINVTLLIDQKEKTTA